jgi:hypothetical protein
MQYVANYANFLQTGCLSGAASMAWGETPSTGARGQLSNPHSMTWCGTPVVDPGRRAGPKGPDEERKASRRGPRDMEGWRELEG